MYYVIRVLSSGLGLSDLLYIAYNCSLSEWRLTAERTGSNVSLVFVSVDEESQKRMVRYFKRKSIAYQCVPMNFVTDRVAA